MPLAVEWDTKPQLWLCKYILLLLILKQPKEICMSHWCVLQCASGNLNSMELFEIVTHHLALKQSTAALLSWIFSSAGKYSWTSSANTF